MCIFTCRAEREREDVRTRPRERDRGNLLRSAARARAIVALCKPTVVARIFRDVVWIVRICMCE